MLLHLLERMHVCAAFLAFKKDRMYNRSTSGRLLSLSMSFVFARAFFILLVALEQLVEQVVGTGSKHNYVTSPNRYFT
jgi:ABC-type methionine transport system permease subunit